MKAKYSEAEQAIGIFDVCILFVFDSLCFAECLPFGMSHPSQLFAYDFTIGDYEAPLDFVYCKGLTADAADL